jgi:hypothetical protein
MAFTPVYNTNVSYSDRAYSAPVVSYGKTLALIGLADSGQFYEPTYVGSLNEAKRMFTSGPIIDACEEVMAVTSQIVYLVRIEDLSVNSFQRALDILLECEIHIVVPIGIYFDSSEDYASLFADFCSTKSQYGECIAVMAAQPFDQDIEVTAQMVDDRVTQLFRMDRARKQFYDTGFYLTIVALSEMLIFVGTDRQRYIPGHTIYAALLTNINPGVSPVNKSLNGTVSSLRYNLLESALKKEIISIENEKTLLARRPIEGSVVITNLVGDVTYQEGLDYVIDYDEGSIKAGSNTATPVSNPAIVSYTRDDRDTLASAGYVTFMDFVKAGVAPASAVTMSKNTIKFVQDIRVMQSISYFIRQSWDALIGFPGPNLSNVISQLEKFLGNLEKTDQIVEYDYTTTFENFGADLVIEVSVAPRLSLVNQSFNIRLPLRL